MSFFLLKLWFSFCCGVFVEKPTHGALLPASEIQRHYKQARHLGCVPFSQPIGEAMDWFVSLGRLFKNTPCCDAQRAALEAGIQPGLLLYKWSGPHWFKVYTINAINTGFRRVTTWMSISWEPSCDTMTIYPHKLTEAWWVCVCESLSHYRFNIFLKITGKWSQCELWMVLWSNRKCSHYNCCVTLDTNVMTFQ